MIKKCTICGNDYKVKPCNYNKSKYCSKDCRTKGQIKNIVGLKFNKLSVIEYSGIKNNYAIWKCLCDCGNEVLVTGSNLICGKVKSCCCLLSEITTLRNAKHNKSYTRIYGKYKKMKSRCFDVNCERYVNYGGRNITICDEWLGDNGFENFYNWAVNNGYSDGLSIERIDVNGNYCPENCKWIPMREQCDNKTTTKHIEFNGRSYTLKELSKLLNLSVDCLRKRFFRKNNLTDEQKFYGGKLRNYKTESKDIIAQLPHKHEDKGENYD